MVDPLRKRQTDSRGHVISDRNVCRDALAKPAPCERKQQVPETSQFPYRLAAAGNALRILTRHEVSGTDAVTRLIEQQPVRANGMVTVVLDNRRLSQEPC